MSWGTGNLGGGSGNTLVVTATENSTITVSQGSKSYTKKGKVTEFKGLKPGKWTVTGVDGIVTAKKEVEIADLYKMTITYFTYIYYHGDQMTDLTGGLHFTSNAEHEDAFLPDCIRIHGFDESYGGTSLRTEKKVNFPSGKFKTLTAKVDIIQVNSKFGIGVSDEPGYVSAGVSGIGAWLAVTKTTELGMQEISCDVSQISGMHYPTISINGHCLIYEIWLF